METCRFIAQTDCTRAAGTLQDRRLASQQIWWPMSQMGLGRVDRNAQRKANFGVIEMLREDAEALKCKDTEPHRAEA